MSITVQKDATLYSFIIFLQTAVHVSDDTLIHHQEHTETAITTSDSGRTIFVIVRWCGGVGSSDSSTSADSSKYNSTSVRCCNYSLNVLPMMGEGIIW